jgi:hypothetical protein
VNALNQSQYQLQPGPTRLCELCRQGIPHPPRGGN